MVKPVKRLVIPVAGFGTRALPASKAVPKEMLPVVDRPIIQYAVDEAFEAGIEEVILVTGRGKSAIEDHFDHAFELEATLEAKGKKDLLEEVRVPVAEPGRIVSTRQQQALGLGHAVWCARHMLGDEPFMVTLPDVLTDPARNSLKQLLEAYEENGGNLVTLKEVPREETKKYGIADTGGAAPERGTVPVKGFVEKPKPEEAPSTLHVLGRYILQPEVMAELDKKTVGAGNEIQLTDAMARLIGRQAFTGVVYDGDFWDCGDKIGLMKANVALSLARPDISGDMRAYVESLLR